MERNAFVEAERMLAAKNLSVAKLCRRADVAESTWHRLRMGTTATGRAGTVGRLSEAFTQLTGQSWPGGEAVAQPAKADAA